MVWRQHSARALSAIHLRPSDHETGPVGHDRRRFQVHHQRPRRANPWYYVDVHFYFRGALPGSRRAHFTASGAADDPIERIDGSCGGCPAFLCDHATTRCQRPMGARSGAGDTDRHIAPTDIGAAWITRRLARIRRLGGAAALPVAVFTSPHRSKSWRRRSHTRHAAFGRRYNPWKRKNRRRRDRMSPRTYSKPYRAAIAATIESHAEQGPPPAVVSIHTFTPSWKARQDRWKSEFCGTSDLVGSAPGRGADRRRALCRRQRTL